MTPKQRAQVEYEDGDKEHNMTFVKYSVEADSTGQQQVKVADYEPGTYESTKPVEDNEGTTAAFTGNVADSTAVLDSAVEQPSRASAQPGSKPAADDPADAEGAPDNAAAAHEVSAQPAALSINVEVISMPSSG